MPQRVPSPDEVSRRAYELWEKDGRPEGRELEHWLRAENELRSRQTAEDASQAGAEYINERSIAADSRSPGNGASASRRGPAAPGNARSYTANKPAVADAGARAGGQRRRLDS